MIRQRAAAAMAATVASLAGLALCFLGASPAAFAATSTAAATTGCTPSDVVVMHRTADLTTVSVQLASGSAGVSCDVSLHSYETEGATWETSGTQTFLGFDSVHLTTSPQTLTVPAPTCFGQVDLVIGTTRFDGTNGPLPRFPNGVFPSSAVIDVQFVTKACGSGSPSPSVSPTATATSSVSPSASVLPTSTATETAQPEVSVVPSPSPSVLGVTITKPTQQGGPLPFTGTPVGVEIGIGVALIGLGAALCGVVAWRRRSAAE